MAAFRFLALLTVGFVLLMLVFLLHAGQSRLEIEGRRILTGPEITLDPSGSPEDGSWELELGGVREAESWPAAQRQPRLFVRGVPAGAEVTARAVYVERRDPRAGEPGGERGAGATGHREVVLSALVDGEVVTRSDSVAGYVADVDDARELDFGPLWMSWEHTLVIELEGDREMVVHPVLRGEPSVNYVAARQMARTLWIVFSVIGFLGFVALLVTLREPLAARAGSGRTADGG